MTKKNAPTSDDFERNTEIALFRYGLIAPLLYDPLAAGELEKALRAIAAKSYTIPHSKRTQVSVTSLRRYLQAYNQGGFEALRPQARGDKRQPRAFAPEVLQKAIALREEQPARTTPMIVQLLKRDPEVKPDDIPNAHTLATHLRQLGKTRRLLKQQDRAFRRFERSQPNELWQGDAMDGPWLPDPNQPAKKRKAYLFCFLDDYSRLVPYAEFFWDEALPRMERVLKVGMLRRGVPKAIYVDNGKVYAANQFAAACATLGIQRIHSKPYCPEGRGKQERFFETVRLQFMPEVAVSSIATLEELNQSFWAWLELIYHKAVHSETHQAPLERYQQAVQNIRPADHNRLVQAFRWRETRKVRKACPELVEGTGALNCKATPTRWTAVLSVAASNYASTPSTCPRSNSGSMAAASARPPSLSRTASATSRSNAWRHNPRQRPNRPLRSITSPYCARTCPELVEGV